MSLILRLAANKVLRDSSKNGLVSFVRPVTLKAAVADVPKTEGHDERNMKIGRPQSPHLTIYAPQLTSMLSISHRITGMTLSAYTVALGLTAIASPESIPNAIESLECLQLGEVAISAMKFALAFPLTYHFWNGIRHLIWDTGKFLTIREVYTTGYVMLLLAVSSAIALSVL